MICEVGVLCAMASGSRNRGWTERLYSAAWNFVRREKRGAIRAQFSQNTIL